VPVKPEPKADKRPTTAVKPTDAKKPAEKVDKTLPKGADLEPPEASDPIEVALYYRR
jgi:hypothetical protein